MSDYTGPGIYELIPQHAQDKSLNIEGGNNSAGGNVIIYKRADAPNARFEIVAAGGTQGKPEIGDREYHILAVNSGLYITNKGDTKQITQEQRSPKDASVRWKIVYAGNGAYYLRSVAEGTELNVRGAGTADLTQVISWKNTVASNSQWILKAAA